MILVVFFPVLPILVASIFVLSLSLSLLTVPVGFPLFFVLWSRTTILASSWVTIVVLTLPGSLSGSLFPPFSAGTVRSLARFSLSLFLFLLFSLLLSLLPRVFLASKLAEKVLVLGLFGLLLFTLLLLTFSLLFLLSPFLMVLSFFGRVHFVQYLQSDF